MKLQRLFTGAAALEIDRRNEPSLYPRNARTHAHSRSNDNHSIARAVRPDRASNNRAGRNKALTIAVVGALVAIPSGLMAEKAKAKWDSEDSSSFRLSTLANISAGFVRKISFSDELRSAKIASPRERELKLTPALALSPEDDRPGVAQKYGYRTAAATARLFSDVRSKRYINKLRYVRLIHDAANKTQIDPALIHAVIAVESNHNPLALSNKGALGLMQLMPQTAARYGVENRMDPAQNINGGARYLADLMRLFEGDVQLVLAAYNAGEHVVIRYGHRIPPYRETMAYVPRVMDYYEIYKSTLWAMNSVPARSALRQTF